MSPIPRFLVPALTAVLTALAMAGQAPSQEAGQPGGHAHGAHRARLRRRLEPRRQDVGDGGVRQHGPALGFGDQEGTQDIRGPHQAGS